ncbi:hypothetical protein AB0D56_36320 [Streptomyces sp. NPDC048209]|uniref:DUF7224 domain-containing protein n=1 Tax=Streptomyces sp. NPDC048209 TaxID=3156689 RepID=UPI00344022EE
MLILPVVIALGSAAVFPSLISLGPLAMAMILCAAHAAIGFGVGLFAPPLIAAPLMALLVWVLVAFSWSTGVFWMRHVSGQYPTILMFGESATYGSLVPHLVLTGGIAVGVALLWLPLRSKLIRGLLAGAATVTCAVLAFQAVQGWGANPPLLAGQAPTECLGKAPKVCVPQASQVDVQAVRKEVTAVLNDLHRAGYTKTPKTVVDHLGEGRYYLPSTADTWRVSITNGLKQGELRYQITRAAVQFPCQRVNPERGNAVMLWAATVTGESTVYNAHMRGKNFAKEEDIREEVRQVLAVDAGAQRKWYLQSIAAGCRQSP